MYIYLFFIFSFFTSFLYAEFKLGIECLSQSLVTSYQLNTKRIGLITNQTGINQKGVPTVEVLRSYGINVVIIFVPEHGYQGTEPAGKTIENSFDPKTKLPIVSLYSHERGLIGRAINKTALQHIDILIFDIQDSGMRHYTYISTLMRCLQAAAQYKKPIFVFDRPNPLGGIMEGPLVEKDLISFISIAPIPLRHGMTIGELARYFNKHILESPAPLHVIRMCDYDRTKNVTSVIKKPLSPNLTNADACFGYSFLGLLGEVRPFDVGVGTEVAFQCILLPTSLKIPSLVWYKAQHILKTHNITSIRYTMFNERKKEQLEGLKITIENMHSVQAFQLFLQLVRLFKNNGVTVSFAPTFDKAVGTSKVKQALDDNTLLFSLCYNCNNALRQFYNNAKSSFLYKPYPIIMH